jgi:sec-independent protein translocase protein TatC
MAQDFHRNFIDHLEELRRKILRGLAAVTVAFVASYLAADRIVAFMIAPLKKSLGPGQSLIGTGVAEAFFFEIKVALVAAFFVAAPVVFYELWRFVAPGLTVREKKLTFPFVVSASIFFVGGALFCYWVVLPVAFGYFVAQYEALGISPEIRISEYFTFFSRMVLAFGLTFELPVLTFFLVRLGLWDYKLLWRQLRYAILVIFILAAVLTPGPDVVSQVLLAVPLLLLYLLSVGIAYVWRKGD